MTTPVVVTTCPVSGETRSAPWMSWMATMAKSSFWIVPVPCKVPIVALTGFKRSRCSVSLASTAASPLTITSMVFAVSPGAKVSVPLARA